MLPHRHGSSGRPIPMLFNTINKGRRGTVIAPFGDQLMPEEIWKIVEFLRDKNRQRNSK